MRVIARDAEVRLNEHSLNQDKIRKNSNSTLELNDCSLEDNSFYAEKQSSETRRASGHK